MKYQQVTREEMEAFLDNYQNRIEVRSDGGMGNNFFDSVSEKLVATRGSGFAGSTYYLVTDEGDGIHKLTYHE